MKDITKAFLAEMKRRNNPMKIRTRLMPLIQQVIIEAIHNSPEYMSLTEPGGELRGQLGVPDAARRITAFIDIWTRHIDFIVYPWRLAGRQIKGGFEFKAIDSTFKDVLATDEALLLTENDALLPWLEWLLLEGDKILITDHIYVEASRARFYSRTNQGIMSEQSAGIGWKVPAQYSGVINDNWITRAIDKIRPIVRTYFVDTIRV
jgi:hypothetical protein